MFLSQPGQWFHWYLATFMDNLALMLMALLVEGGAAAVSGLAAYWMATSASLPVWIEAVIGLALALVLSALLVERRLALAATNIKFAADRFDEALIRDEPADG
jgi:membrane protein implicated in regulation of membrane protease activity